VFADSKASLQLKAVRGDTESSLYTVGDKGMIVQYSDGVWQILNSGIESHFSGVWVSPDSQVFVIAEETGKGTIYLFPRD
jgi:hypothetical protein